MNAVHVLHSVSSMICSRSVINASGEIGSSLLLRFQLLTSH